MFSHSVSIHRVWTVKSSSVVAANAGSSTMRRWNGSTVAMPSTWNSASARRERSSACGAVGAGHDQLRQQRVELAADDRAGLDAGVDADPGPRRVGDRGHGARRGQEVAAGVLAVDPELDGVPPRLRVLQHVEHLALGDAELLAHQVQPRGLLGHRVLHLQPGVHLEERDQPVLRRRGTRRSRRRGSPPPCRSPWRRRGSSSAARRTGTARAPPRRASGTAAAASSPGCPTTITLPCVSARTCASTWRGLSR